MLDFTHSAYARYLEAISSSYACIPTVRAYLSAEQKPTQFCILRHDVDRAPKNALRIAQLESARGLAATYYFRVRRSAFAPAIIKEISDLGHEIGFHYESLSSTGGDMQRAVELFRSELQRIRELAPVDTVAMHGSPLSKHDNRELWKDRKRHHVLTEELGILGEVYLDVDYSDMAYVTDTGRNWRCDNRTNIRDHVSSQISADFKNSGELIVALQQAQYPKLVLQTHPERWHNNAAGWLLQLTIDCMTNNVKAILRFRVSK